jgi:hypothetical protein
MTSFSGPASWGKMMSPEGKLAALVCHPNKKVNKSWELTYISTTIDPYIKDFLLSLNNSVFIWTCMQSLHGNPTV